MALLWKGSKTMKFAIMESVMTPGGHEIDYDRILVEELQALGHEVVFYVPEGHAFCHEYGVPVHTLSGAGVSYGSIRGIRKWGLAIKREWRRRGWYHQLLEAAKRREFDAVIFPSATYRYLRGLRKSRLLQSPVPLLFLIHGLTPDEAGRLQEQAQQVAAYPMVRIGVQTFAPEAFAGKGESNISYFPPPSYLPRDIQPQPLRLAPAELKLGFFGQYRREKKLDEFLELYLSCQFSRPVNLLVQGATANDADAADFERLIAQYKDQPGLEFLHQPLIGKDWQAALDSVDVLMMPYGAPRYRYHTSAMLSNAIGHRRPVIISDIVNPEVLRQFPMGEVFPNGDWEALRQVMERFVNEYNSKAAGYAVVLEEAYAWYAPRRLAAAIVEMAQKGAALRA